MPKKSSPTTLKKRRKAFSKGKITQFRSLLNKISGEDPADLLMQYLNHTHEGKRTQKVLQSQENMEDKLWVVVDNICGLHSRSSDFEKRKWLSMVSHLPFQILVDRGFAITQASFTTARKHARSVGPYGEIEIFCPRPPIEPEIISKIHQFCQSSLISRPSPNRMVYDENKNQVPVHHLEMTKKMAFEKFEKQHPDVLIHYSSFLKYFPRNVKPPCRETDLCPQCEEKIKLESKKELTQEQKENLKDLKKHHDDKNKRRDEFHEDIRNLKEGDLLLIVDFKENITLNRGQREVGNSFFNRTFCSFFGVTAVEMGKKINYYDYASDILSHNTTMVMDCVQRTIEKIEEKNEKKFNNIIIWLDNGPEHFKTFQFMNFAHHLKKNYQKISISYFIEYHGKSYCDAHFARISSIFKFVSSSNNNFISSVDEFIAKMIIAIYDRNIKNFHLEKYSPIFGENQLIEQTMIHGFRKFHDFEIIENGFLVSDFRDEVKKQMSGEIKFSPLKEVKRSYNRLILNKENNNENKEKKKKKNTVPEQNDFWVACDCMKINFFI
jgi:hypothetical protein